MQLQISEIHQVHLEDNHTVQVKTKDSGHWSKSILNPLVTSPGLQTLVTGPGHVLILWSLVKLEP